MSIKIQDYTLLKENYKIIAAMNSLQYVGKDLPEVAPRLIQSLKTQGLLIARVPLKIRSKVLNHDAKINTKKLLELFQDLEIIHLQEYWSQDKPHPGANFPHKHYLVDFVAKKN